MVVGEVRYIFYLKWDGNIVWVKGFFKVGCSIIMICKGEIIVKDNRKYGGIW